MTQKAILEPIPSLARYVTYSLIPNRNAVNALRRLAAFAPKNDVVVGIGQPLVTSLGKAVPGLRDATAQSGKGVEIPATPRALWVWLRGSDRGALIHLHRAIDKCLAESFQQERVTDGFKFDASRDLTGYEDGTENPKDDDAVRAAFLDGAGVGLDGSSFVAVQTWVHNLDAFELMSPQEQDNTMGRCRSDNEEIDDAPPSAHVKRTAQESFEPQAFVLRRSMPWTDGTNDGLVFVAFGRSFDAFESLLNRMIGLEDGIIDGLFKFTRPIDGCYYWCPPVLGDRLDLSAIGIG